MRQTLRFIRSKYSSVEGYLDVIGVGASICEALRTRLIQLSRPSGLLYRLPPAQPFWTDNPAVYVPMAPLEIEPARGARPSGLVGGRRSPLRRGVLRLITLLQLRDTFARELSLRSKQSCWGILASRVRRLQARRKRSVLTHARLRVTLRDSRDDADRIVARHAAHLATAAERLRWDMRELLLGHRVVLAKLGQALARLHAVDVAQLLQFRNTQLYAERNQRMRAADRTLSLTELYLTQWQLFYGEEVRSPRDVIRVLMRKLQAEDPALSSLLRDWDTAIEVEGGVPVTRTYQFERPVFFFHELRDARRRSELAARGDPLPATFAEWLMYHWMLPTDEREPIRNPFVPPSDACLVPPDILASYTRLAMSQGLPPAAAVPQPSEWVRHRLSATTTMGGRRTSAPSGGPPRRPASLPVGGRVGTPELTVSTFYECLREYVESIANLFLPEQEGPDVSIPNVAEQRRRTSLPVIGTERYTPSIAFNPTPLLPDDDMPPNASVFRVLSETAAHTRDRLQFKERSLGIEIQTTIAALQNQYSASHARDKVVPTLDTDTGDSDAELDTDEEHDWVIQRIVQDEVGTWLDEMQDTLQHAFVAVGGRGVG